MSHLATSTTVDNKPLITDLEILKRAAERLGLTFVGAPARFNTYGGSRPLSDHGAIGLLRLSESKSGRPPYDVAITPHRSGTGYNLLVDTFDSQIRGVVGDNTWLQNGGTIVCPKLMMEYYMEIERTVAAENGDEVEFTTNEDGSVTSHTYPALTRLQEIY